MQLRNSSSRYGLVSITLHWLVALAFFSLFGLGLWMTSLSFDHPWASRAPALHKAIGLVVLFTMALRLLWRLYSPAPKALASHSRAVQILAHLGHMALYLGVFAITISGYLVATSEGDSVSLFGWFDVPALISDNITVAALAAQLHQYGAWGLTLFAVLHGVMAIKHHVIDKDSTLKRMIGRT